MSASDNHDPSDPMLPEDPDWRQQQEQDEHEQYLSLEETAAPAIESEAEKKAREFISNPFIDTAKYGEAIKLIRQLLAERGKIG